MTSDVCPCDYVWTRRRASYPYRSKEMKHKAQMLNYPKHSPSISDFVAPTMDERSIGKKDVWSSATDQKVWPHIQLAWRVLQLLRNLRVQ